jgi:hypothetical protein
LFFRKRWMTLALLAIGLIYTLGALQLGIKTRPIPQAGFVPFLLGLALIAMSAWELLRAFISPSGKTAGKEAEEVPPKKKLILFTALLFGAIFSFEWLGFPLTAAWMIFISSRMMGLEGLAKPAILALCAAIAADLLFVAGLGVPLPGSLTDLLRGNQ